MKRRLFCHWRHEKKTKKAVVGSSDMYDKNDVGAGDADDEKAVGAGDVDDEKAVGANDVDDEKDLLDPCQFPRNDQAAQNQHRNYKIDALLAHYDGLPQLNKTETKRLYKHKVVAD